MAKKQRVRERRPYRTPEPAHGRLGGLPLGGGTARRPAPTTIRRSGGLPILPLTLAGLAIGVIVIAFVALSNAPSPTASAGPLNTPPASYPGENADLSLGSPNAPVTINEYADFQCPACKAYTLGTEPNVVQTYVRSNRVRIVFHDYAFIGPESITAATAAQCAGEQRHFWVYHGYLYANQGTENSGRFSTAFFDQVAAAVGLDKTAFDACLSGGTARSRVVSSTTNAGSLGISQTPTLFIGNQQPIEGAPSFAQLSPAIDAALAAAGGG